jgi:hypothetical protein
MPSARAKDRSYIAFMHKAENNSALAKLLDRPPAYPSACMSS